MQSLSTRSNQEITSVTKSRLLIGCSTI